MKKWKRFLASVCAAVCAAGFSLPSFAADRPFNHWDRISQALSDINGLIGMNDLNDMETLAAAVPQVVSVSDYPDIAENLTKVSDGVYSFDVYLANAKAEAQEAWKTVMDEWQADDNYVIFFSFRNTASSPVLLSVTAGPVSSLSLSAGMLGLSSGYSFHFKPDGAFHSFSTSTSLGYGNFYFNNYSFPENEKGHYRYFGDMSELQVIDDLDREPQPPTKRTLTIQYQYEDGSQAAEPAIRSLAAGDLYEVVSPVLSGYTADKPTVSGTMPDSDLTITVIYTAIPPTTTDHTLTIQYHYEDGSQAAELAIKTYQAGAAYQVVSPVLNGYTADKPTVSGVMPDRDLTITVVYTKSSGGTGSDDPWDISPGTDWSSPFEWYDIALNATWGSPFNWFDIAPDTQWHSTFPWS
ncbi:hypothetical protein B5F11_20510 [Anaerotruncus colihominis]|uniref:MucBP domain-containing protein n=2 Tax=Anaerotruncus colihominis TaxID=169435 RepID=A0A1Y4M9W0_9FIRM|nr:MucBP domain-containing protein [Anaerotruncus colihominis]OUP63512.1 hypothetical protein B5F11_20510 [Anaerotruncus colihominis]